jgi:hypothetical protein
MLLVTIAASYSPNCTIATGITIATIAPIRTGLSNVRNVTNGWILTIWKNMTMSCIAGNVPMPPIYTIVTIAASYSTLTI